MSGFLNFFYLKKMVFKKTTTQGKCCICSFKDVPTAFNHIFAVFAGWGARILQFDFVSCNQFPLGNKHGSFVNPASFGNQSRLSSLSTPPLLFRHGWQQQQQQKQAENIDRKTRAKSKVMPNIFAEKSTCFSFSSGLITMMLNSFRSSPIG